MLGPRQLGAAEIAYWDEVFAKLVQTKAWRESLEKNLWVDAYTNSATTAAQHKKEYEVMRSLLKQIEMEK